MAVQFWGDPVRYDGRTGKPLTRVLADEPESLGRLIWVWSLSSEIASFSLLPLDDPLQCWERYGVYVPSSYSLQPDPLLGVVLAGVFTDGPSYAALGVLEACRDGVPGFRFRDSSTRGTTDEG
jgi:hypothetical protein